MKKQIILTIAAILLCTWSVQAASIEEPSTVFYGKVIGTGDAQPFIIHQGALEWTIRNGNGSNVVFTATLFPLNNGEFSYRLDIPHSAIAYELDPPDFGIPLPAIAQTNSHVSATVDGVSVEFIGPSGNAFTAGQVMRAQTWRLDMAVNVKSLDSDSDGIPDWWEDLMGLDKQLASDASGDGDGDLVSNLDEYRNATDPRHDDRKPTLVSDEILVFPESVTGVRLVAVDVDSSEDQLLYTLTQIPAAGKLILRNASENPVNPDLQLIAGAQFTQADVESGRLVYVHDETDGVEDGSFDLTLTDGVSPESASGTVKISFYSVPENLALMSTAQKQRQRAYRAAQGSETVIWDAVRSFEDVAFAAPSTGMSPVDYTSVYQPKFGDEQGQVMTGGRGDDDIRGGMADDVLVGGIGSDTLAGGGGADLFIFDEGDDPSDVISDFNPAEGDRIDLSGLLASRNGMVHESLLFQISGTDTLVKLNVAAGESDFSGPQLILAGIAIDAMTGYELVLDGMVAVGNLKLQPCITVAATDDVASENGGNSGVFTFTRRGDLSKATDVNILIGGTAQNGTDYSSIGPVVHFEPGESVVTLQVVPFADGAVEADEIVEIILQGAEGYCLGRDKLASLTVKDLQSVIGIEVLQARGSVSPTMPAVVLVKRNGQTANALFVRLNIGGKAFNGVDYNYINSFVEFAAGQTTIAVQITPTAYASLSGGAETVTLEVAADSSYALADIASGAVVLVETIDTLASWKERVAPASATATTEFALQSSGVLGLDYLRCYAYGIDPQNPDSSLLPQISFRNGRFNVDVHQNPAAADISYIVEGSTDLQNWSTGVIRTVIVQELVEQAGVVTYEAIPAAGSTPRMFIRVRAIYNN